MHARGAHVAAASRTGKMCSRYASTANHFSTQKIVFFYKQRLVDDFCNWNTTPKPPFNCIVIINVFSAAIVPISSHLCDLLIPRIRNWVFNKTFPPWSVLLNAHRGWLIAVYMTHMQRFEDFIELTYRHSHSAADRNSNILSPIVRKMFPLRKAKCSSHKFIVYLQLFFQTVGKYWQYWIGVQYSISFQFPRFTA